MFADELSDFTKRKYLKLYVHIAKKLENKY